MSRLALVLWLCLAGAAGAGETVRTVEIAGWLEVQVPAGFTAAESDRGLLIREDGGQRTPLGIEILRRPIRTFIITLNTRDTPMGIATWTVVKREAEGSGGAEWTLWIKHPAGWILARQQRELGRPDFARVWEIVDTIRPPAGG